MSSSDLDDEIVALNSAEQMEQGGVGLGGPLGDGAANGGGVASGDGRGGGDAESAPLLGAQAPTTYDAVTPVGGAAPSGKKAKKDKDKGKSGQKLVADALKTDMAAERTFFKWLWTGLHVGAIGTFIFVTFDNDEQDPYRFAVVFFAWAVAFGLVLYGLFAYSRRRAALREGRMEVLPWITREYGPCIVVAAVALVVFSGLAYALFSGAHAKGTSKFHGL
jgi:uncharacterized membrane protein YidH (DUF202 family)